jgi:hypothetical protein
MILGGLCANKPLNGVKGISKNEKTTVDENAYKYQFLFLTEIPQCFGFEVV